MIVLILVKQATFPQWLTHPDQAMEDVPAGNSIWTGL